MLEEQQLVALLVKLAVAASAASILMRFGRIQRLLLKDSRTLVERIQLALLLGAIFGAGAEARILSVNTYSALDLALESAIIAGHVGRLCHGPVDRRHRLSSGCVSRQVHVIAFVRRLRRVGRIDA